MLRPNPGKSIEGEQAVSKYERWGFWVGIGGLGATVIATYLASRAIDATWAIARASGSLDRSRLAVGVGGYQIEDTGVTQVILGAPNLSDQSAVAIGSIPFTVKASGARTTEDVTITFQYDNRVFNRKALEAMSVQAAGGLEINGFQRQFTEANETAFASYRFESLNPGTAVGVGEPFYLAKTAVEVNVPITTRDGVSGQVNARMNYALRFGITASAKDVGLLAIPVELKMVQATSMNELMRAPLHNTVNAAQIEFRRRLSFPSYLGALLFSSPDESVYLVFVPQARFEEGDAVVFAPTNKHEVKVATFPLVSWHQLFGGKQT